MNPIIISSEPTQAVSTNSPPKNAKKFAWQIFLEVGEKGKTFFL